MPISQTGARMDTEADDYLNEWREVSLTSVADIRFSSVNKVSQPGEEPVRLCNYTDVYKNDYITADMDFMRATATKSEIERFGLQVGDVIITKDSETPDDIGISTVVDTTAPDLVCGYHLALLRPKQDEVDPTFLAKQLAHHRIARYFGQQANGTTRYGLSTAAISNAPLHLPGPENQRAASALMRMVDAQISQTETVIAKLKQVWAGMLHDLLSYGLDEHGQLRDPIAHPEQFKDSPLGQIPREWDVKPLSSVCQKIADRDHTTPVYVDDGIRMVSPIHFKGDDEIDFEACPRITRDAHRKNCLKTDIRAGDLILHRIGAGLGQIRRVTPDMPEFSILHSLALVRTAPERITADFLYWVIQSNAVKTQISLGIQSIGVPDLGLDKIGNLLVLVPHNSDEQTKIAQRLSLVADSLKRETSALNKAKHLKLGLQDDLLTGRVRVPETIMEGAENA